MSDQRDEPPAPQQPATGHGDGQGSQTYPGPQYESPQYASPRYETPQYGSSQVPAQQFGTPASSTQDLGTQQSGTPQFQAPEFQAPGNATPLDAAQPEGSRPDGTQPSWTAPQTGSQAPTPYSQQPDAQGTYSQQPYAQAPYSRQTYPQQTYSQQTGSPASGEANQQWQTMPPSGTRVAPSGVPSAQRSNPLVSTFAQTPVTWSIIAICVLVWIGERASLDFGDRIVLSPYFGRTEPWRFVTSAFAHALSPAHIAFNMYALWTLRMLEVYLGRLRFAVVYLLCAIAGGAAFVVLANPLSGSWISGVVGASGAIFGLFGVLLFAYRDLQASTRQLWIVIGINMAISFTIPGIAWQAHVGGFLMGLMAGWLLVRERDNRRAGHPDRSWLWLAALFALEVVVVVLKYAMVRNTWIN